MLYEVITRKALEVGQRGIAGAEIVHRQRQAKFMQFRDQVGGGPGVITSYSIHYTKLYDGRLEIARIMRQSLEGHLGQESRHDEGVELRAHIGHGGLV